MKIFLTYFTNINRLKQHFDCSDTIFVSISLSKPKGFEYIESYKALAPTWSILNEYKQTGDIEKYKQRYKDEVLSKITPQEVLSDFSKMIEIRFPDIKKQYWKEPSITLVCYEAPDKFCHRQLVAEWLNEYDKNLNVIELSNVINYSVKYWADVFNDLVESGRGDYRVNSVYYDDGKKISEDFLNQVQIIDSGNFVRLRNDCNCICAKDGIYTVIDEEENNMYKDNKINKKGLN